MIQDPVIFYQKEAQNYLRSLDTRVDYSQLFVLTDERTSVDCLPVLLDLIGDRPFVEIQIESGEQNKTIGSCEKIWSALTSSRADRNALVLLLGGGVLTDMGAFAASCYKRGIRFLNVPTTLLAMVDASTGAKTGIDFNGLKNHIGLFSSPLATLINPEFLKTLDQRQLKSGVCEMFKHGLIASKEHWQLLRANLDHPEKYISASVSIKVEVVNQDPTEKGLRKILNFGHTLGHAIETHFLDSDSPLLHGEAIAAGILLESYLSHECGSLPKEAFEEISTTLNEYYSKLPQLSKSAQQSITSLMMHDKKNHKDAINFVALEKIGKARFDVTYSDEAIQKAFEYYNNLTYR